MPSVPADRGHVDCALAKLREDLAREIRRLDARLISVVPSNNDTVDVELVDLQSVDLANSTEINKSPPSTNAKNDPNADAVDITASGSATIFGFGRQEDAVKGAVGAKAGETRATELQNSDEVNMVCFDRKSAWSVPLVLTWQSISDGIFSILLLLLNAAMQILFTSILLSPSFLGNGFDEQVEGARIWRRSSAHDAKNMDLAQRSLVLSREWGNGLWRRLLGIIQGLLKGSIPPFPTKHQTAEEPGYAGLQRRRLPDLLHG